MTTTLYTIGHSRHPLAHFMDLLKRHGIRTLADVRSRPYSRWAPQFRKNPLAGSLELGGVEYVFLGSGLGGRPDEAAFYDAGGQVDYTLRRNAPDFLEAIEQLGEIAARQPTAIMCAEEDPRRCHRRLLVTPALLSREIGVVHIRGDGRLEREGEIGDVSPQLPLFGSE